MPQKTKMLKAKKLVLAYDTPCSGLRQKAWHKDADMSNVIYLPHLASQLYVNLEPLHSKCKLIFRRNTGTSNPSYIKL